MSELTKVWVAYATETEQFVLSIAFQENMTVADAIELSGIRKLSSLPEPLICGIFGVKVKDLDVLVHAGDRVEIYRPLTINPKDIRRNRARNNPVGRYCRGNRFKQLKQ